MGLGISHSGYSHAHAFGSSRSGTSVVWLLPPSHQQQIRSFDRFIKKHIGTWSPGADEANCMQCAKLNRIVHRCGFFTKTERSFHFRSCSSWDDEIGIWPLHQDRNIITYMYVRKDDVFKRYSKLHVHVCESYQ